MKLFPSSSYDYKLVGAPDEALERLRRKTEITEMLSSQFTDKSFRGKIEGDEYRIISSAIGRGAFSVMSGKLDSKNGVVEVEINKAFQILIGVFYCFPIIAFAAQLLTEQTEFSWALPLVAVLQFLMIRFLFVEFGFRRLSKESLRRLGDVLDTEWMKKASNNRA